MPEWSLGLCNLYYRLRLEGRVGCGPRRYWYRQIEKEKARLLLAGLDGEEVRLICRWLANPANSRAERAWRGYSAQLRLPF